MNDNITHSMKERYEQKKKSANDRGIDFAFTLETYDIFWKLRLKVKCFFTDKPFNPSGKGVKIPKDFPTAERLDQSLPYSPENCVWVTHQANQLKAQFIEQGNNRGNQGPIILGIINRIEKILNNPRSREDKFQEYKDAYTTYPEKQNETQEEDENTMTKNINKQKKQAQLLMEKMNKKVVKPAENVEVVRVTDSVITKTKSRLEAVVDIKLNNQEIAIARDFAEVGAMLESAGALFELTFNQFKLLMARKSCAITGRHFQEGDVKTLYLKVKGLPYSKNNVIVTSVKIQKAIDTMLLDISLNQEELKKLGEVLGSR